MSVNVYTNGQLKKIAGGNGGGNKIEIIKVNGKSILINEEDKSVDIEVPIDTSDLNNDSGFISEIPSNYITEEKLNDKGYLTEIPKNYVTDEKLEEYIKTSDLDGDVKDIVFKDDIPTTLPASDVPAWAKQSNKPTYNASEVGAVNKTGDTMTGTLTVPQLIDSGLNANTAVIANGSKQLASSAVTSTELGYLSGVTSAIQTQLNGKLSTTGKAASATTADSATTASSCTGNATTATTATKLGSSNVGSFTKPMYLNSGTPTECGSSLTVNITGSSASCTGNAATATKATQDGAGNNISETYAKKNEVLILKDYMVLSKNNDGSIELSTSDKNMMLNGLKEFIIEFEGENYYSFNRSDITNSSFFSSWSGVSLGRASNKWKEVYAGNGTIQTSDRNEKNSFSEITSDMAKALILGLKSIRFKMNNGTSDRFHWGLISQDVEELLGKLGWDSKDFAGFIKSPHYDIEEIDEKYEAVNEDGITETRIRKKRVEVLDPDRFDYSLRYDEFISPMIKVIQDQEERIRKLENPDTDKTQNINDNEYKYYDDLLDEMNQLREENKTLSGEVAELKEMVAKLISA